MEHFIATLGGDLVRCESAEDAAAINLANELLNRVGRERSPAVLIEYLCEVLRRYGRQRASVTLIQRFAGCTLSEVAPPNV